MKSRPAPSSESAQHELSTLIRELRADAARAGVDHLAQTLLREPDLRAVLVVMATGAKLAEHHAKDTATLHVLEGRVRLGLARGDLELGHGYLVPLARGLEHDVTALEDSAFLLTLARSAS